MITIGGRRQLRTLRALRPQHAPIDFACCVCCDYVGLHHFPSRGGTAFRHGTAVLLEGMQGEPGRVSPCLQEFSCHSLTLPSPQIEKGYHCSLWLVPEKSKDGHVIDVDDAFQSRQQILALASRNRAACENNKSLRSTR